MQLSIIVCCFNSEQRLPKCLSKIEESLVSFGNSKVEVVIVDNASSDNTRELATSIVSNLLNASYKVITEHKQGLMHARWAGVRAAKGEIVCFIDDDNWTTDKYFKTVVTVFNNQREVGFFGCSTKLPEGISFPAEIEPFAQSFAVGHLYQKTGILEPGQMVWGAGMAVRRLALLAIINSSFQPILHGRTGSIQLAGDDSELVYALTITGWRGWYQCEVLIEHSIDTNRMNPQKLMAMHQGFGASDSVISCYLLYINNNKTVVKIFFTPWYCLKILKRYIFIFIHTLFNRKSLYFNLLKERSISSAQFFKSNRELLSIFERNISELSKLNKNL